MVVYRKMRGVLGQFPERCDVGLLRCFNLKNKICSYQVNSNSAAQVNDTKPVGYTTFFLIKCTVK